MKRAGFWTMLGGFTLAFLPVFIAVVGGLVSGTGVFNDNGYGAALWLLIVTFPAGMVIGTVGFVFLLIGASRARQAKNPPST